MPRSVVDLEKLNELDAAIVAFDRNTGASMAAFYQSAKNLLAQFETKLSELDMICQEAMAALRRCESRQKLDDKISCASEEAAFDRAYRRYSRCAELVNQARQAVSVYDSYADQFRQAKHNLCSRAANGINRVRSIIVEYTSDLTPNMDNVMSNGVSVVPFPTVHAIGQSYDSTRGDLSLFAGLRNSAHLKDDSEQTQNSSSDENMGGDSSVIQDIPDNDFSTLSTDGLGEILAGGAVLMAGLGTTIKNAWGTDPIQQMKNEEERRSQKRQKEAEERAKAEYETAIFKAEERGDGTVGWIWNGITVDKKFNEEFNRWKNTEKAKKMIEDALKSFETVKPDFKKGITYKQLEDVINEVLHLKPEEIRYFITEFPEEKNHEKILGKANPKFPQNAYVNSRYINEMSVCGAIGVAAHEGTHVWQYKINKLMEKLLSNEKYRGQVDYYKKLHHSLENKDKIPYWERFHEMEAYKIQYIIGEACTKYYNSTITKTPNK